MDSVFDWGRGEGGGRRGRRGEGERADGGGSDRLACCGSPVGGGGMVRAWCGGCWRCGLGRNPGRIQDATGLSPGRTEMGLCFFFFCVLVSNAAIDVNGGIGWCLVLG